MAYTPQESDNIQTMEDFLKERGVNEETLRYLKDEKYLLSNNYEECYQSKQMLMIMLQQHNHHVPVT